MSIIRKLGPGYYGAEASIGPVNLEEQARIEKIFDDATASVEAINAANAGARPHSALREDNIRSAKQRRTLSV